MKIFVDADACPVVRIVEKVAEKYEVSVTLLCDTKESFERLLCKAMLKEEY